MNDTTTTSRCALAAGSAPTYEEMGGHVRRAFVIYEETGKIPQKKGQFAGRKVACVLKNYNPLTNTY